MFTTADRPGLRSPIARGAGRGYRSVARLRRPGQRDTVGVDLAALTSKPMTIAVELPDTLKSALFPAGEDPSRAVLEAVALEGYRTDRLSESDIRQLLGFETRMEVHAFLKERGVVLHYTIADLEHDCATAALAASK